MKDSYETGYGEVSRCRNSHMFGGGWGIELIHLRPVHGHQVLVENPHRLRRWPVAPWVARAAARRPSRQNLVGEI